MDNGKVIKLDTTDRISQLPESILHHILTISYSDSPKLLVRMSVLSKYWFSLTAAFPILDFDIGKFNTAINGPWSAISSEVNVVDKFFRYVEYTTSRYCQQKLNVHTFKLYTCIQNATQVNVIDKCLALILMEGIKVLEINIFEWPLVPSNNSAKTSYRLTNILLLAASSLTSLTVCNCCLPLSFKVDIVTFKSLKLLHLYRIPIDEKVIKHLTTSCPILEELSVKYCYGFKTFWVCGLQNLQKVWFYYRPGFESVDIKVPNLCCLSIINSYGMGAPRMNFTSCKQLRSLHLDGIPSSTSEAFSDLLRNFPFLESLFLKFPDQCEILKLSSPSLRKLVLHTKCSLDAIDINTPNLVLFSYSGYLLESDSLKLKPRMECYPENVVGTLWIQKLRRFLDKKYGFRVLKLQFTSTNIKDIEELKVLQWPPYELEHVELELHSIEELSAYFTIVDAVLWCCRPQSLSLTSCFTIANMERHVIKFIYEKLLQQEDRGPTNIQIVFTASFKGKKRFSNLNSLLAALPRYDQLSQTITFTKEKVVQGKKEE
ncbi:F-box domain, Leucine-rich repeat domain, L domain-like protein [Artemisia annua]|uniref:F-box domain, Leucine-rich repeat domain, L domain-like protein n=1 Tax=Artemisia annua TaxID=35608 RepID=A0A2U1NJJ8_ARTAN|nr:F-box domain, Leucine-rich repeat domain, L domain-like protein [Artemisia annua]